MKEVTNPELLAQLDSTQQREVTDPALLAQLNGEKQERQPMSKWDAIKKGAGIIQDFSKKTSDAIKGNSEFEDARSWEQYSDSLPMFGGLKGVKVAAAGIFGTDEDKLKSIQHNFPDLQIKQDRNGNPYFLDENGRPVEIDKSGLDLGDVADSVGQALPYVVGGVATSGVKNLLGRTAATATAEGGVNVASQKLAGREDIDEVEALIAGATGGAFELALPLASNVWRWAKTSKAGNKEAGTALAKELNMSNLTDEQIDKLGYYINNLDENIDPKIIASHVELNQTPTAGTLTGKQSLLDAEQNLRNTGRDSTKQRMQSLDDSNQLGLNKAIDNIQSNPTDDYLQTSEKIGQLVKNKEQLAKQATNDAYSKIDDSFVESESFANISNSIKKSLSNENVLLDPNVTPRVTAVLKDIDNNASKLKNTKAVSWQAVEAQRKRINSVMKGANPEEKRALTIIKNKYDDIANDAFENNLFSGTDEAMDNIKNARSVTSDYFKKFKNKGDFNEGKIIDDWLKEGVTPEKIANGIFNLNGSLKIDPTPLIRRYKSIIGNDPQGMELIQDLAIKRLMGGKNKTTLRNALTNSLNNKKTFMNEVFSNKQLGFISRTLHFLDNTALKGDAAKSSGTAERLYRWLTQSAGNDASLTGLVNLFKRGADSLIGGEKRLIKLPMKQLNPTSDLSNATRAGLIEGNTGYYSNQ
jgi:hypothetical protein